MTGWREAGSGSARGNRRERGARPGSHIRCRREAVLYLTSLSADETTPEDLLAHVRGHWRVEHAHWLHDVAWKDDKSLIRTGNGPQIWSALTNLVITLFRIHGVTGYAAETRRTAQVSSRSLQLLNLPGLSPG